MKIECHKIREDVLSPVRANPSDAGLDVFFCPEDGQSVRLMPGDSKLLGTGLKFGVPHGYMLEVKNRSSVAYKRSLVVGSCVIDSGYNGEVKINLHNIGNSGQVIEPGEKIAQLVMIPVVHFRVDFVEDKLYDQDITISARDTGGFGSTGA